MRRQPGPFVSCAVAGAVALALSTGWARAPAAGADTPAAGRGRGSGDERAALRAKLRTLPWRIVYESFLGDSWELRAIRADGSGAVNLTNAPRAQDLYPHASPDGKRICFVVDEGEGKSKTRSVYCMNADGTGRTLVARNARQPCWTADGRSIAYLKGEFARFTYKDFASKGLVFYDVRTRRHRPHVNAKLHHLYNPVMSPDGGWFLATVHGGMGHRHANLAFEAAGTRVFPLPKVGGCRPDISPDGRKVAWNLSDQVIAVADLDLTASGPRVANVRKAVTCDKQHEVYHADWSPDGRYLCFSYGPKGPEQVGLTARDWHICVADASKTNVWVVLTTDGISNKEPDWLPAPAGGSAERR
jgi:hypothetical protein